MKKVLFATDYSHNANLAFDYAYTLAKAAGAKLAVFHAFKSFSKHPEKPRNEEIKFMDSHAKSGEWDKLRENYPLKLEDQSEEPGSLKIEYGVCALEDKHAYTCIIEYAKEVNADMIVVGSRGENPIAELLFGTTPLALIKQSHCPVLIVPRNALFAGFSKIFYATDLNKSDVKAIDDAAVLANLLDAELVVGHVSRPKDRADRVAWQEFQKIIRSFIQYERLTFELWIWDDILDNLELYCQEKEVDLLVMMERDRPTFFAEVFERDVVEEMIINGTVPLLVYSTHFLGETPDAKDPDFSIYER